ncbi:MAG: SPOR domain-containing protein [Rhodobacteraceae bacterium]|nr:SPOR domain-containing protein [Paracoccaceae bacterium]
MGKTTQNKPPATAQVGYMFYVRMMGAALSLFLVISGLWWAYGVYSRGARDVPLVLAPQGTARVLPTDPGGLQIPHQNFSLNAVIAGGEAAPMAQHIRQLPASRGLAPEDASPAQIRAARMAAQGYEGYEGYEGATTAQEPPPQVETEIQESASPLGARPRLRPDHLAQNAQEHQADGTTFAWAPDGGSAPAQQSPAEPPAGRWVARLGTFDSRAGAPAQQSPVDPPAGRWVARLGTFDSRAGAEAHWQQFYARYGTHLNGKQALIESASLHRGPYHRLHVTGFRGATDAQRWCAVLEAIKITCYAVEIP